MNELLPTIGAEDDGHQKSEKEDFLLNHPDILHKFGVDLLPILIQVGIRHSYLIFLSMHFPPQSFNCHFTLKQVVNSGVNLFICFGCLSVISKLVHFSTSDALHSLLQTANFSR